MRDQRMLAIPVMLAALVGLWAVGCSGISGTESAGPFFTITMKGGTGGLNGGYGGYGGDFEQEYYYGSGKNLELRRTGVANATFEPTWVQANLGPQPYVFTANTTVYEYSGTEPATGTPYLYDGYMFVSDGDGTPYEEEEYVTGFRVNPGVTLTLDPNDVANTEVGVEVTNDIENLGTITTKDDNTSSRKSLWFYCADWLSTGTVDLKGNSAGQDGGSLYTWAYFGIANHGPVWTYGADALGTSAGDGGDIEFISAQFTENTADLLAYGGAGTGPGGAGGDAGEIDLETDNDQTYDMPSDWALYGTAWGDVRNSGRLHAYGGAGTTSGGDGADVEFESYYSGRVVNSGEVKAYGGAGSEYYGGEGGDLDVYTDGGNVINSAEVDLHGGSTDSTYGYGGGPGGDLYVWSTYGSYDEPTYGYPESGGGISWSGNINTSGGNAPATAESYSSGGSAGDVYFGADCDGFLLKQPCALLGYASVDTRGGDANWPGWGGYFDLYNEYSYEYCCKYTVSGIVNEASIDTRGGSVLPGSTMPAYGANGGYAEMYVAYDTYYYPSAKEVDGLDVPKVFNSGAINTSGGNGWHLWGGDAGYVWITGRQGIDNLAPVTARGGHDLGIYHDPNDPNPPADPNDPGIGGYGGDGGEVTICSDRGHVWQVGDIDQRGGDGARGGGDAGGLYGDDYPTVGSNDTVLVNGNIYASGGNGGPWEYAWGGDGNVIWLYSSKGPNAVTHTGAAVIDGGKGAIADRDGDKGVFIKGNFLVDGSFFEDMMMED